MVSRSTELFQLGREPSIWFSERVLHPLQMLVGAISELLHWHSGELGERKPFRQGSVDWVMTQQSTLILSQRKGKILRFKRKKLTSWSSNWSKAIEGAFQSIDYLSNPYKLINRMSHKRLKEGSYSQSPDLHKVPPFWQRSRNLVVAYLSVRLSLDFIDWVLSVQILT